MNKTITGLLVAMLMALGLVGLSGTSASAACGYGGCASTDTELNGPRVIRVHHIAQFDASVDTVGSGRASATPRGKFVFHVNGRTGPGKNLRYISRARVRPDGNFTFSTPELKRGRYDVRLYYVKKQGSPFRSSSDHVGLRVLGINQHR